MAKSILQRITTRAKRIRQANPKKEWRECVMMASKEYKAGKLGASSSHKDTASHNVRIKVVSGAKRKGRKTVSKKVYTVSGINNNAIHTVNYLASELRKAEGQYEILKTKKKAKQLTDPFHKKLVTRYPNYIRSLKKQLAEAKKNIK